MHYSQERILNWSKLYTNYIRGKRLRRRLTKRDVEESRRFCEDSKLKIKPFPKIKT